MPDIALLEPNVLNGVISRMPPADGMLGHDIVGRQPWADAYWEYDIVSRRRNIARPNTPNSPAVIIDQSVNATVSDPDSAADFNGGSLTAVITANLVAGEDSLSINTTNVTLGNALNHSSSVTVGGTVIGTIAAVGNDQVDVGESLVINFTTTDATPAKIQTLLRSLEYTNTGAIPGTTARTLSVTINDGDGKGRAPTTAVCFGLFGHPRPPSRW